MQGTKLVLVLLAALVGVLANQPDDEHFLFSTDPDIHISIRILVGILGFDDIPDDQAFSPLELREMLERLYPIHRPSQASDGAELPLHFDMVYDVRFLDNKYMSVLDKALVSSLSKTDVPQVGVPRPEFAATVGEELFNAYEYVYNDAYQWSQTVWSDSPSNRGEYVVFIVYHDNDRLKKSLPAGVGENVLGKLSYAYAWGEGGSAFTQTWIGKERYVVHDISAGPVLYGSTGDDGTIVSDMSPLFVGPPIKSVTEGAVVSRAASVVVSAIQQTFLGDMAGPMDTYYASRLLVPVIMFRNHNLFDPLDPSCFNNSRVLHELSNGSPELIEQWQRELTVDVGAIRSEIERLLLPKQKLVMVLGSHVLQEHPRVASALYRSMYSKSVHEFSITKGDVVSSKSFIDPESLLYHLGSSADMLAAGLIPDNARIKESFYDSSNEVPRDRAGTRVLPVYIFSSSYDPQDNLRVDPWLFADMNCPWMHSSQQAVFVMQNAHFIKTNFNISGDTYRLQKKVLPFFSTGKQLVVNMHSPTRHVMAGIAEALGNVLPPYTRYSQEAHAIRYDYRWWAGATPFGPLGTNLVSSLYTDAVLRNYIMNGLRAVLLEAKGVVDGVNRVGERTTLHVPHAKTAMCHPYLYGRPGPEGPAFPSTSPLQRISLSEGTYDPLNRWQLARTILGFPEPVREQDDTFIHQVAHHRDKSGSVLGSGVVSSLHDELEEMEGHIRNLVVHLLGHDFESGMQQVTHLLGHAKTLSAYAKQELEYLDEVLSCVDVNKAVSPIYRKKNLWWKPQQ